METLDLFLRYGFGIAVIGAVAWITWALARLAREKAQMDETPRAPVEE